MNRCIAVLCMTLGLFSGCARDRECERARLNLSKAWRDLVQSASRRQLAGVDPEGWKWVQGRVALLESSFATTQVTWNSADKARGELTSRLNGLQTDTPANLMGYRLSVESALREQDAFAKKCR